MTAPTMTRLGELRINHVQQFRGESPIDDFDNPITSWTTQHIDGLRIVLDSDGADTSLAPTRTYRIAPNDGWAVDTTPPHVMVTTPHLAHLVDAEGRPAVELPLTDGTITLDRAHSYELRHDDGLNVWTAYQV
jgi:hypothetical protein